MQYLEFSPRTHAAQASDPAPSIVASPHMVIAINREWIPYIMGALEVLAQPEFWHLAEAKADEIGVILAGMGKAISDPDLDQLDGLMRPTGAIATCTPVNGAGLSAVREGYQGHVLTLWANFPAVTNPYIQVRMHAIDAPTTPCAVRVKNVLSVNGQFSTNNVTWIRVYTLANPTGTLYNNVAPASVLNNVDVTGYDYQRYADTFVMVHDLFGPAQF